MQSSLHANAPVHLAIIMDGNGRWATRRGLPRGAGHQVGAKAVRRVIEAAPDLGIGTLTLFAFSTDNWQRPAPEVEMLMALLRRHLRAEVPRLVEAGVRLKVIGRRDRLPAGLAGEIHAAEAASTGGRRLLLRLAIDYSSRRAMAEAAAQCVGVANDADAFERAIADHFAAEAPPVDLLIRTGGEQRLSDFLLWENAYAEFCFTPTFWPDFDRADLQAALADFHRRERRFGGLGQARTLAATG